VTDDINAVVDRFFEARAAIFAHVGYVENWRLMPIDDSRDQFWAVDKNENEWVKFSPKREALVYWLTGHDDEYGPYGDVLYENVIYTQRHLPKWVYRGKELTLVVADTQTDGNKHLQIFRNENEVRSGSAAVTVPSVPEHPLNQAIDRMIDANRPLSAADVFAKVTPLCAGWSRKDLRIAIDVHRANCHDPGCPVLAAMEEIAAGAPPYGEVTS
jgi:hypothetical protein